MSRPSSAARNAEMAPPTQENQWVFHFPVPLPREIRSMREYMSMTHVELAKELGASVYMVREWERGGFQITEHMAKKLRKLYDRAMGFDSLD